MSLKYKFALLFSLAGLLGAVLTLAAAVTASFTSMRDLGADVRGQVDFALFEQTADGAEALLVSFESALRDPLYFNDFKGIDKAAQAVAAATNVVSVRVYDNEGFTIHDGSGDLSNFGEPAPEQISGKLDPGQVVRWVDGDILRFASPICIDGECIGAVMVGMDGNVLKAAIATLDAKVTESEGSYFKRILTVGALAFAVTALISIVFGFILAGRISLPIKRLTAVFNRVAEGEHDIEILSQDRSDEIGELARTLSSFLDISVAAARSKSALEVASANFMITDADGAIIAMNKSAFDMFRNAEHDLREVHAGFNADELVGGSFEAVVGADKFQMIEADIATKIASAGKSRDDDDTAAEKSVAGCEVRLAIGERKFDLTVTPVLNARGERLGSAVEWKDMTQQLATEDEVAGIVIAAGQGDFSQRLEESGKDGFMLELARGMNELVAAVDSGISQMVDVVSAFADGDLTKRMDGDYKGKFLRLKQDSNRMGERIATIAGQIGGVTTAVQRATDEISAGVSDLSTRTEHQASSLEETSASMEELSATVRQNANNAQEASQVAATAREAAVSGGEVAGQAVSAMGTIAESSRKITDIVGLIQEIAFQTNLLALNASVEAARAGEAGRGFAVVANEVRALAQRAAVASKDIKELIVNSDTQIQQGVILVDKAGAALEEIVDSARKVADFVSEIAAASQEQTSGIDQVSGSITGMDEMTQQNAALVEETTAALGSAQTQMVELQNAVSFFKLGRGTIADSDRSEIAGDDDDYQLIAS